MEVEGLVSSFNIENDDLLKKIRILELEKNKDRLDLGARRDVQINENCDTCAVGKPLLS